MKQLRNQFGARFVEVLSRCPTLVQDVADLRANNVRIRRVGGHCQAYSMRKKNTIYIGSKCKLSYQLIALAHEKVHILVSPTDDPIPGKTGRQEFINSCLESETDAIMHEVIVVGELLAAGETVDAHSMKWYRRFQRGGREAIRTAMETAVTSNTGEKYPEYYGLWYDDAIKPKHRLPFLAGNGDAAARLDVSRDPCPHMLPHECALERIILQDPSETKP